MRSIILIFLAFTLVSSASAQFNIETGLTGMYDDNINNNYLQLKDRTTQATLQTAYDWESETNNTQLYYSGSLTYFSNYTSRTFYYHSAGITYSQLFGNESETILNIGGSYSFRVNREEYIYYNNNQLAAYVNIKFPLSERMLGRLSYNFRLLSFGELPDFNYFEHYGFVQTTIFLPTKTTLIFEADLGTKIYTTPNIDTNSAQTVMYGRSKQVSDVSTPRATQLIGIARIGQAVIDGTGLSLTTQYQVNLEKESRYLLYDEGSISDDELFDDHYGYEGWQTTLLLTQLLPEEIVLKIAGTYQHRTYSSRPAFDLDDNIVASTRIDTRKNLSLSIDKGIESLGLKLGLTYDYIVNSSNDMFYDYKNNAVALGISFEY